MKARPILFNTDMVKAILSGQKTQTRREIKPHPFAMPECNEETWEFEVYAGDELSGSLRCPFGQPGDLLYVRETFAYGWNYGGSEPVVFFRATGDGWIGSEKYPPADVMNGRFGISSGEPACSAPKAVKWKPSIHMPRWASRLTLEITDVRVERLQDIGEEDARAEGISDGGCLNCGESEPCGCDDPQPDARDAFIYLWNSIYSNWHANPWVWVVEFKVHHCNVDALLREREAA